MFSLRGCVPDICPRERIKKYCPKGSISQYTPYGSGSVLDVMISAGHDIQYIIPVTSEYQETHP